MANAQLTPEEFKELYSVFLIDQNYEHETDITIQDKWQKMYETGDYK